MTSAEIKARAHETEPAGVMLCECCWVLFKLEKKGAHWMDWGEWLCDEHAAQAIEDDAL